MQTMNIEIIYEIDIELVITKIDRLLIFVVGVIIVALIIMIR